MYACYIVYNNERTLEGSLKSILPFVDKVIMVDGVFKTYPHMEPYSTDHTRKIAQRCGDKLIWIECEKPWSTQVEKRNEYLKHVPTGQHFIVIDSDVVLKGKVRRELKIVEQGNIDCAGIKAYTYNIKWNGTGFIPKAKWGRVQWIGHLCKKPAPRIFKKYDDMEYRQKHFLLYVNGRRPKIDYVLKDVLQTNQHNRKSWEQWTANMIYRLKRPEKQGITFHRFLKKFSGGVIPPEINSLIAELSKDTYSLKRYFRLYNELGEKYPESEIVYSKNTGIIREKYLKKLLLKRKGLTLDVGCGDGHYKKYIKNFVGLDLALSCLTRFKGERVWSPAEYMPFKSGGFDTVFVSELLEHIERRLKVLLECFRVLKSGGEIIVSVPFGDLPWMIVKAGGKSWNLLKRYGVTVCPYVHGQFSEEYLKNLLAEAGFTLKSINVLKTKTEPGQRRLIAVAQKLKK